MKRYRKITLPQPSNQMLLVAYTIHQCIGNYRFELFNKRIKAQREIKKLRKLRQDIDNDMLF